MGLHMISCPECKQEHQWFSGCEDQRCPECQKPKKSGIELTDEYILACKEIDPSLKSIKIIMKGDFNREITKVF